MVVSGSNSSSGIVPAGTKQPANAMTVNIPTLFNKIDFPLPLGPVTNSND